MSSMKGNINLIIGMHRSITFQEHNILNDSISKKMSALGNIKKMSALGNIKKIECMHSDP